MLLFKKRFHAGLVAGTVTRTFRLWEKPHVKVGGRYRVHPIGVVEVTRVERRALGELTEDEVAAAGFSTRDELLDYMAPVAKQPLTLNTEVFDVTLRHAGDGDRVQLAMDDALDAGAIELIRRRLERLDRAKPWTLEVLRLIRRRPRVAASRLAISLKRPTLEFKVDVRKLKKLGLTQSFEVGYELSPRGRAYLDAVSRPSRKSRKPSKSGASRRRS